MNIVEIFENITSLERNLHNWSGRCMYLATAITNTVFSIVHSMKGIHCTKDQTLVSNLKSIINM